MSRLLHDLPSKTELEQFISVEQGVSMSLLAQSKQEYVHMYVAWYLCCRTIISRVKSIKFVFSWSERKSQVALNAEMVVRIVTKNDGKR